MTGLEHPIFFFAGMAEVFMAAFWAWLMRIRGVSALGIAVRILFLLVTFLTPTPTGVVLHIVAVLWIYITIIGGKGGGPWNKMKERASKALTSIQEAVWRRESQSAA